MRAKLPWIVLLLAFTAITYNGMRIARNTPTMMGFGSRSDFEDYWQAARKLSRGDDPYRTQTMDDIRENFTPEMMQNPVKLMELAQGLKGVGSYLYPPFLAFLLMPLSDFSYEAAVYWFQSLSALALLGFGFLLWRHVPEEWAPAMTFALILTMRFQFENAGNGNIGSFLLLLIGAGILLAYEEHLLLSVCGGLLLGLAVGMKITPVVFGAVLLAGRRYAAIGGMGVGLAAALVVPALALGWEKNLEFLTNWYGLIVDSYSRVGFIRAWANNQTLSGAVGKLFVAGSDMKQSSVGLPLDFGFNTTPDGVALLAAVVRRVNTVLLGITGLIALLFAWRRPLSVSSFALEWRGQRLLLLAALVSLVTSGVSWYHAYSVLLLPVFFQAALGRSEKIPVLEKAALGVTGFFGVITALLPVVARDALALTSVLTWASLVLILWLAVVLFLDSLRRD